MFAYDLNTNDLFKNKSNLSWDSSNIHELNIDSVPNTTNTKSQKRPHVLPSPISPPRLPPSAFTQISSPDAWTTAAQQTKSAQSTATNEIPPPPQHSNSSGKSSKSGGTEEGESKQNLYKTEMCKNFQETGMCRYGTKCQFAHGSSEMRGVQRHPKYKTEICRTYHTSGTCAYGKRCRFVHHANEMRTQDGEILLDNNYTFQQQLTQLKFVDIMPSPNQSLFSSPGNQEWLFEVENILRTITINPDNNNSNLNNLSSAVTPTQQSTNTATSETTINQQTETFPPHLTSSLSSPNNNIWQTNMYEKPFDPKELRFEQEDVSSEMGIEDFNSSAGTTEESGKSKKLKSRISFFQKFYNNSSSNSNGSLSESKESKSEKKKKSQI